MLNNSSRPVRRLFRAGLQGGLLLLACQAAIGDATALAQSAPRVNYLHHEFLPPGVIAQEQLRRNPGMPGYHQAVELIPPEGARISVFCNGEFQSAPPGRLLVGMQLGYVYSLKLTQLPLREGVELFPTVEVINRIHPPEGTKTRFPVPIEISEQDVAQALSGLFVMRVVYLEDSDRAFQQADDPDRQRSIDVSPTEDPLHVADRYGRPMAIVRLGSRVPENDELVVQASAAPPVLFYPARQVPEKPVDVKAAIERQGQDIPRQNTESELRSSVIPGWRFLR